jgi:hydroxymethylpyrimidine/phosphomethylpyrimidine kinase
VTLSQDELARFSDCWREPEQETTLLENIAELAACGCGHLLVTGIGGGDGARVNSLYEGESLVTSLPWTKHLPGPFVGAGCTLSGALIGRMARGLSVADALGPAHDYTTQALIHACRFGMGRLIPNKLFPAPSVGR